MECSPETIMKQAGMTAHHWMCQGRDVIDEQFGDGYAEKHHELLVGFMTAAGSDEIAMYLHQLGQAVERLAEINEARLADAT